MILLAPSTFLAVTDSWAAATVEGGHTVPAEAILGELPVIELPVIEPATSSDDAASEDATPSSD